MALFHEVVKSIELVRYLTVHVELETEIDTAAVKQDGGTAASWLLPIHCAFVPLQENPCCSAEALFQPKNSSVFPGFLLLFSLCFNCLFSGCCCCAVVFRILVHYLSIFSVLCKLLPSYIGASVSVSASALAMWPAHLCSRCFFLCLGPFRILS